MRLSLVFLLALSCAWSHQASRDLGLELNHQDSIKEMLDKLRLLETNLDLVLSKVLFLAELEGRSSWEELLEKVLARFERLEMACGRGVSTPPENTTSEVEQEMVPDLEPAPPVDFHQPSKSDCHELDERQRISGVYRFLEPEHNELQRDFYERYCFFASDGGPAWTVIQQRGFSDPPEDFQRTWEEYRAGFGNLSGDFWFGNEFTHKILYRDDYELRVELTDGDKQPHRDWAEYSLFRLDSEAYNYQLTVDGGFRGSLDDALELLNQVDFSTHDRRSDLSVVGTSCSELYDGGWWFNGCTESNLNGHQEDHRAAIIWPGWVSGIGQPGPRSSRMMIRPVVRATVETTVKNEV